MIPFGLNQEQFCHKYRQSLDKYSQNQIAELRKFFALNMPKGIDKAEASLELPTYYEETGDPIFPSFQIYFSGKNNKIDKSDKSIYAGATIQLDVFDDKFYQMTHFDDGYFIDEHDFYGLDLVADTQLTWFAECWWKAGGWDYVIPTILSTREHGHLGIIDLTESSQ